MARRSGTRRVATYLLAGTAMATALGGAARAEFPGEVWSVAQVRVSGADDSSVANGLTLGLTKASEIYFYGDTSTRIEADVTSSNAMDLRMVDLGSGKVVAERRGLPFDGGGDVAGTITNSALAWMESLSCSEGCAVATVGPAPQAVQVATAPVASVPVATAPVASPPEVEEPQAEEPAQPDPVIVAEAPKPDNVKVEAAPQPVPVVVAEPPKAEPVKVEPKPEPVIALAQPEVTVPRKAAPVTRADLKEPTAEALVEGLDADQVLAAIESPEVQKPRSAVAAAPKADTASASQPSLVALPKPKAAQPSIAAPAQPEATATAPVGGASSEDAPEVAVAAPSLSIEQPAIPETSTDQAQPEVVAAAPQAEINLPAVPAVEEPKPAEPVAAVPEVEEAPVVAQPAAVEEPVVAVKEPEPKPEPLEVAAAPVQAEDTAVVEQQPEEQPVAAVEEAPVVEDAPVEVAASTSEEEPVLVNPAPAGGATEQLALANPNVPQVPALPVTEDVQEAPAAPPVATSQATDEGDKVETQLAAVDLDQEGPTLANARWIGFTPAVFTGADTRPGAWIAGPFDRKQRTGWITDTATGATTRVTFYWREASSGGRTATLSREAASAIGIGQGDVANVAVYLPR